MPEKVMPGPVEGTGGIREAVCVHTRKIYDSCRDKDCIEDLRFYPKLQYVDVINHALSVKGGSADLLYVYVDVEPVNFNRGFYTVDMRFFYNVTLQAYTSCPAPVTVEGLCVFDKRAILFGSEGNAKIFSSEMRAGEPDPQMMQRSNTPIAVGAGVIACEQRHSLADEELEAFENLFGQIALIEWVDGKLLSTDKVRGRKQALRTLAELAAQNIDDPAEAEMYVLHADAPEDADRLVQLLREKIPGLGNISTRYVGPVIGAHCGPGTVAVCFFGKERPY